MLASLAPAQPITLIGVKYQIRKVVAGAAKENKLLGWKVSACRVLNKTDGSCIYTIIVPKKPKGAQTCSGIIAIRKIMAPYKSGRGNSTYTLYKTSFRYRITPLGCTPYKKAK